MLTFEVTPTIILTVIAVVLAFLFDYFPLLRDWYDTKSKADKRIIMLALLLASGVLTFTGSCLGWFNTNLICTVQAGVDFFIALIQAITYNQGFHMLTKPENKPIIKINVPTKR